MDMISGGLARILASVLMLASTGSVAFARDGGSDARLGVQERPAVQTPWTEAAPVRFDTGVQSVQLRAFPLEQTLIARADGVEFTNIAFVEARPAADGANPSLSRASSAPERTTGRGLALPRPGPAAAFFATLALGLFFFLRRIV